MSNSITKKQVNSRKFFHRLAFLRQSRINLLLLLLLSLQISVLAGGSVKARQQNSKYKAKAQARCDDTGTNRDRDVEFHPNTAVAFARNPSNTTLALGASMESWIGPLGWGMTPIVARTTCSTGEGISDFFALYHVYQISDISPESGSISGGSITFDPEAKSVSVPNVTGTIEINSSSRYLRFYITIWENENDDDEFWGLPTQGVLWQGSAIYLNGQLTLDGFSAEEITVEEGNQVVLNNFSKNLSFPGSNFDNIEVDIRYETEEEGEMLISNIADQTAIFAPNVLMISPNPISQTLRVENMLNHFRSHEEISLNIFDVKGSLVLNLGKISDFSDVDKDFWEFDVSYLSSGVFYLSASSSSRIFVAKFIKNQ